MRRKSYSGKAGKIVKTSITIPEVLVRFAEERMALDGHATLSGYLVHLLQRARERQQELDAGFLKSSSLNSPPHHAAQSLLQDSAAAPPPKKSKAA